MLGVEIFDKEGEFFYEDLFNQDSRLNRNKIKQEIKAIALDAHERGLLNNQIDIHQDTDTFAANAVINLIEEYAFLYLVESWGWVLKLRQWSQSLIGVTFVTATYYFDDWLSQMMLVNRDRNLTECIQIL